MTSGHRRVGASVSPPLSKRTLWRRPWRTRAARRIAVESLVLLRRGLARLSAWQDWGHRRRCLRRPDVRFLNDSALKDIGLTRDRVGRDSANTFWRP